MNRLFCSLARRTLATARLRARARQPASGERRRSPSQAGPGARGGICAESPRRAEPSRAEPRGTAKRAWRRETLRRPGHPPEGRGADRRRSALQPSLVANRAGVGRALCICRPVTRSCGCGARGSRLRRAADTEASWSCSRNVGHCPPLGYLTVVIQRGLVGGRSAALSIRLFRLNRLSEFSPSGMRISQQLNPRDDYFLKILVLSDSVTRLLRIFILRKGRGVQNV